MLETEVFRLGKINCPLCGLTIQRERFICYLSSTSSNRTHTQEIVDRFRSDCPSSVRLILEQWARLVFALILAWRLMLFKYFLCLIYYRQPFFRITVPTMDTVRYEFVVSALLYNSYPVLLTGPVGTGKTSTAQSVLGGLDTSRYSVLNINMSAQVRNPVTISHGVRQVSFLSVCA